MERKYTDSELVRAYLKCDHSQIKAASVLNVGRETVARAVRRSGIQMDGRRKNGNCQPQKKITDEQIIFECFNGLSCSEIANKYEISVERLYRRARKIGITLNNDLQGGHWKRRSSHYGCADYDNSITLKSVITRYDGICQICGKPVDLSDIENGHIKRNYPTVDHIIPLSKGGTHTWGNIQLAHMACNSGKCDRLNYTVKREEVWT